MRDSSPRVLVPSPLDPHYRGMLGASSPSRSNTNSSSNTSNVTAARTVFTPNHQYPTTQASFGTTHSTDPWKVPVTSNALWGGRTEETVSRPSPRRTTGAAATHLLRVPPSPDPVRRTAPQSNAPHHRGRLMEGPTDAVVAQTAGIPVVWGLDEASESTTPWTTGPSSHDNWFVPPPTTAAASSVTQARTTGWGTHRTVATPSDPLFDDSGDPVDRTPRATAAPLGSSRRPILATNVEDGSSKRPISIHDADLLDRREKDVLHHAARKQLPTSITVVEDTGAPLHALVAATSREHDILQHAAAKRQQERTETAVLPNSYSVATSTSLSDTPLRHNRYGGMRKSGVGGGGPTTATIHPTQGTPKNKGFMGFFRGGILGGKRNDPKNKGKHRDGSSSSEPQSDSNATTTTDPAADAAVLGKPRPTPLNAWGSVTEKPKASTPRFSNRSSPAMATTQHWTALRDDANPSPSPTHANTRMFDFEKPPMSHDATATTDASLGKAVFGQPRDGAPATTVPFSSSNDDGTTVSGVTNPSYFHDDKFPKKAWNASPNALQVSSGFADSDPFDANSPVFSAGDPFGRIGTSANKFTKEPVLSDDFSDPFFPGGTEDVTKEESGVSEAPDPDLDHVGMEGESSDDEKDSPPVSHIMHHQKWTKPTIVTAASTDEAELPRDSNPRSPARSAPKPTSPLRSVPQLETTDPTKQSEIALKDGAVGGTSATMGSNSPVRKSAPSPRNSVSPNNRLGVQSTSPRMVPTKLPSVALLKPTSKAPVRSMNRAGQASPTAASAPKAVGKSTFRKGEVSTAARSSTLFSATSSSSAKAVPDGVHTGAVSKNMSRKLRDRSTRKSIGQLPAEKAPVSASSYRPSTAIKPNLSTSTIVPGKSVSAQKGGRSFGVKGAQGVRKVAQSPVLPPSIVRISHLSKVRDTSTRGNQLIAKKQDENTVSSSESSRPTRRPTSGDISISSVGSDIQRLRSILRRSRLHDNNENFRYMEPLESAFAVYDEQKIKDPMQRAGLRLLSTAVIPIQSAARRYLALRSALTRMWAIVVIQAAARRWMETSHYLEQLHSAVKIQSFYRGVTVRDQILLEHCCAIEIQRHVRGLLASLQVFEEVYKITLVQACIRRKLAIGKSMDRMAAIIRVQAASRGCLLRLRRDKLNKAVTRVQTVWRTFSGRFNFQLDLLDILIVQSVCRRKFALDLYGRMIQDRRERSVILIQSQWRSYDCTMNYLHYLADVLITQCVARRWLARRRCASIRNSNALVIQTAVRTLLAQCLLKRIRASIAIQSTWRGFMSYADYMFTMSDIVLAQSIARCWLKKKDYPSILFQHKSNAAITIQKHWRGFSQATDYYVMLYEKKAATTIQTSWRRFVHFSNFHFIIESIVRIQALCRAHLARETLVDQIEASLLIQSAFRVLLAKNRAGLHASAQRAFVEGEKIEAIEGLAATAIQSRIRGVQVRDAVTLYKGTRSIQSSWRRFMARAELKRHLKARRIQTTWRRYVALVEFDIFRTVRRIQTAWRGYIARSDLTIYLKSRQIQTAWRRYAALSQYNLYVQSRTIQTSWRRYSARSDFVNYTKARCIQASWRRYAARSDFVNYTKARCIQASWRRYSAFSALCAYKKVRCIQSLWRGHVARVKVDEIRKARSIQAAWRGYVIRATVKFYVRARSIQAAWRGFATRWPYKEYVSSRRIQSAVRQWQARSILKQYMYARCIQSWWRCAILRRKYRSIRTFLAARCIQTFWRCKSLSKAYDQYVSARAIQTMWRSKSLHSVYIQYVAARKIQARWRCKSQSNMYHEYKASRQIQTLWRCKSQATVYKEYIASRRIQSIWRCKNQASLYREYIAARRIQSMWRCKSLASAYNEHIAARRIQTFYRCKSIYKAYTHYIAARRIQTVWRCRSTCDAYRQFINARRIQTAWRGKVIFTAYRQFVSIRLIQSVWRGRLGFVQYRQYIAARRLQSVYRGWSTSRSFKRHCAVCRIQKIWRGKLIHYSYKNFVSARRIQTFWRCKTFFKAYSKFQGVRLSKYTRFYSACRIQAAWRKSSIETAYKQYVAARRIQAFWRCKSLCHTYNLYRVAKASRTRKFVAARRIQSFWRCRSLCNAYKVYRGIRSLRVEQYKAARRIQTNWRCSTLQRAYNSYKIARGRRYEAFVSARSIQSSWRCHIQKAAFTQYLAARFLQAFWRGKVLRTAFSQYVAARRVQAAWRGKSIHTAFKHYHAARRIQAVARGRPVHKAYNEFLAARCVQAFWRGKSHQFAFAQFAAAKRIQSVWRGKTLHGAYSQFASARLIQSQWRGKTVRSAYVQFLAVQRIQAVCRGRPVQKAYREYLAARTVQSFWRCASLQTAYAQYRAANRIQVFWRCVAMNAHLSAKARSMKCQPTMVCKQRLSEAVAEQVALGQFCRRSYKKRVVKILRTDVKNNAATDIARAWRGFEARQYYWHMLGSAIEIQAVARGWMAQRRLRQLREHAVAQIRSAITIKAFVVRCQTKRKANKAQIAREVEIDQAARNIQRFFLMVKAEVDRAIRVEKKRRKSKKKTKPSKDVTDEKLLESVWRKVIEEEDSGIENMQRIRVEIVGKRLCFASTRRVKGNVAKPLSRSAWSKPAMQDDLLLEESWLDAKTLSTKERRRAERLRAKKLNPSRRPMTPQRVGSDRRPPRKSQEV